MSLPHLGFSHLFSPSVVSAGVVSPLDEGNGLISSDEEEDDRPKFPEMESLISLYTSIVCMSEGK
jgi:hypothetical protein